MKRKLNPLTLNIPVYSTNSYKDTIISWTDGDIVWADIITDSGSEGTSQDETIASNSLTIKCLYQSTIKNDCTFSLGEREFAIVSINNVDNKGRELIIRATESLSQ